MFPDNYSIYCCPQIVAFPTTYGKHPFAYNFKGDYAEDGWKASNIEAELKRLVCVCVCVCV